MTHVTATATGRSTSWMLGTATCDLRLDSGCAAPLCTYGGWMPPCHCHIQLDTGSESSSAPTVDEVEEGRSPARAMGSIRVMRDLRDVGERVVRSEGRCAGGIRNRWRSAKRSAALPEDRWDSNPCFGLERESSRYPGGSDVCLSLSLIHSHSLTTSSGHSGPDL